MKNEQPIFVRILPMRRHSFVIAVKKQTFYFLNNHGYLDSWWKSYDWCCDPIAHTDLLEGKKPDV